jgi:hypothetical protein
VSAALPIRARGERQQIRRWMRANVERFVEECGEVNCTQITEAWDRECSTGEMTLDTDHPAWEIAVDIAFEYGKRRTS